MKWSSFIEVEISCILPFRFCTSCYFFAILLIMFSEIYFYVLSMFVIIHWIRLGVSFLSHPFVPRWLRFFFERCFPLLILSSSTLLCNNASFFNTLENERKISGNIACHVLHLSLWNREFIYNISQKAQHNKNSGEKSIPREKPNQIRDWKCCRKYFLLWPEHDSSLTMTWLKCTANLLYAHRVLLYNSLFFVLLRRPFTFLACVPT